jgi:hypothetical protein
VELQLTDEDKKRVEQIWAKVFESSNRVILQHEKFGFQGVVKLPHPDVHVMVVQLKYFGSIDSSSYGSWLGTRTKSNNGYLDDCIDGVNDSKRVGFVLLW